MKTQGPETGERPLPLYRNRNYNVLWTGQLFSELAAEVMVVAFPLLILAMSGSPLQMGLASSVIAAASMIAVVPAGVMADRWDRRKIMLVSQGVRAVAVLSLVVALAMDAYSFPLLLVVAAIEGLAGSVFDPAEHAALPQVVHSSQLSAAVARNTARPYVATLIGPVVAGLLFTVHPANPFVANAAMLVISTIALLFVRLPRRTAEEAEDDGPVAGDVAAGFRWLFAHRVIRTTLVWIAVSNLVFSALLVIVLAMSGEEDVAAGEIGLMMTCFGVGGLLGASVASRLHAALPAPVIVIGFSWVLAAATAALSVVPSGLPFGVLLGVAALLAPVANTTALTYQMTVTPDELRGRLSGVVGLSSGVAGALGPLAGGVLMTVVGGRSGLVACAVALAVIALGSTLSPTLRRFPNS